MKMIDDKLKIAVFASGNGSNAENIIRFFREKGSGGEVVLVVCNRREAGVVGRAAALGVDVAILIRDELADSERVLAMFDARGVNCVVLAGFLLMVPPYLIRRYEGRMVNIHPSLLPKFGGKGMYGHHVHEAVVAAGECETGITVHLVSEEYDKGQILFQARVAVAPGDTAADVERKVRELEMRFFPGVIARLGSDD